MILGCWVNWLECEIRKMKSRVLVLLNEIVIVIVMSVCYSIGDFREFLGKDFHDV